MPGILHVYTVALRGLVKALAAVAGLGLLLMMGITCLDVILRGFGRPLVGAFDLVRVMGAVTLSCALPYTTAVKGHVAIEYFFHKLAPPWRVVVDTLVRGLGMTLFGLVAWQCVRYGEQLRHAGETTPTLQLPIFWIPYVIACSSAVVALVILQNLIHPGREMIKP